MSIRQTEDKNNTCFDEDADYSGEMFSIDNQYDDPAFQEYYPKEQSKRCSACDELKPLSGFHIQSTGRLGRNNICAECKSKKYAAESESRRKKQVEENDKTLNQYFTFLSEDRRGVTFEAFLRGQE